MKIDQKLTNISSMTCHCLFADKRDQVSKPIDMQCLTYSVNSRIDYTGRLK